MGDLDAQLASAAAEQLDREVEARQLLARGCGIALIALSSSLDERPSLDPRVDPLGVALVALAFRGRRLIRSAIRLLDAGDLAESVPLLRIVSEYLIVAMWLKQDPERLAGWAIADHEKRALIVRKVREELEEDPALQDSLGEQLRELENSRASWTEPLASASANTTSIEAMADAVGISFAYQLSYRIQSQADVHASTLAVDSCFEQEPSGTLRLRSAPVAGLAQYDQYALAAHLLLDLLAVVSDHLAGLMWRTGLAGVRQSLVASRASDPRTDQDPARILVEDAIRPSDPP